ncbi:MAG: permease-like cell division protein FtsX [bacterium]|nr:permease-like cell division protein FtsX [bacterium]
MRNLQRLVKIAITRISRNPYHALAAFLVMFLTFFVVGAFILASIGSNTLLSYFESRPAVTAFLKDGTSIEKVKGIQDDLTTSRIVSKTRYVSKEEALKIYKERNKDEPLLTEFVTADVLPASIEVSTYKLEDLSKAASILKKDSAVEEVVFQKNIVETLTNWTRALRNIGGAVVLFLLATAFLTTLIVVGLNISLHKDEIEIMRLVGATSWYIRIPFILEGIFYGAFSALVATAFLWGIFTWISPNLQRIFSGVPILPTGQSVFLYLLLFELVAGTLIGVIGSSFATRKYLTV